ncbi:Carbonic anhydrase [Exophiala dermatitidis]
MPPLALSKLHMRCPVSSLPRSNLTSSIPVRLQAVRQDQRSFIQLQRATKPGIRSSGLKHRSSLLEGVPSFLSSSIPSSTTSFRRLYCSKHTATPTTSSNDSEEYRDARIDIMPSANLSPDDAYARAFNNNSEWRRSLAETEPELFEQMSKGQSPQILWIGCADSRCPETTILGLKPGEIFCHRNIANILVNTDINSLSVIQYAVQYLQVKHIIVCGHTQCGGIAAALDNKKLGLIDTWLMPLRALRQDNLALLNSLNEVERGLKMVELNVRNSVKQLLANPVVIDGMHERGLQVHGLIYDVGSGELRELDIEEDEEVVKSRVVAFKTV